MPVGWRPTTSKIEELITEEQAKIDAIQAKREWRLKPPPTVSAPMTTEPDWTPTQSGIVPPTQVYTPPRLPTEEEVQGIPQMSQGIPRIYMPPRLPTTTEVQQLIAGTQRGQTSTLPQVTVPMATKPVAQPLEPSTPQPFWKRALQIFAAPFEWVDENVIKPGEALVATTTGLIDEVARKPGEDFWEWKKRSWAGWDSPGVDIKVPWSEDKLRLDIRGVLELAPWLLIPGTGVVGGVTKQGLLGGVRSVLPRLAGKTGVATREATGIAGMLGKAEKVGQMVGAIPEIIPGVKTAEALGKVTGFTGRVLGTVIEYSPWGIAEKTAGVAIKGGVRAAGRVSERVSTAVSDKLFGKYVPPPVSPAVEQFTKYAKEVIIPARKKATQAIKTRLRPAQEARLEEVHAAYRRGEIPLEDLTRQESIALGVGAITPEFAFTTEALAARKASAIANVEADILSGKISKEAGKANITKLKESPAYSPVSFTKEAAKELDDMIVSGVESGFVEADAGRAFRRMVIEGVKELPQPHHIKEWGKVFGVEFAKVVGQLQTPSELNRVLNFLNIGRAAQTSMDFTGTLRQGLFMSLLHPLQTPKWFVRQIKSMISEKWALEIDDAMRADPLYRKIMGETGSYIAPIREATLTTGEELFASDIARRIPGIRRSERAFITYINQARFYSLKAGYGAMKAQGASPAEIKLLGRFIDISSGRGEIPKSLEKFAPMLNAVLFSPRLQAATLQMPRQIGRMLLSKNPYMRKEAAKALVTFVGGGASILGLISATGHKVEIDPRSGDFGKIKIGETRLDIWRGYLQYIRFAAQMLSGERKSAYGNMSKAQRSEIASRFLQSKSSPLAGLFVDILRGENYMGEPLFRDTTGFSKIAKERLLPLAAQDIIDAVEMNGANGMLASIPATLGIGTLTYVNDFVRIQKKIAEEMGYESWDDIDPKTQKMIQNTNAELQAANIELDRNVMGTAWGDWGLAGRAIDDVFRENIENASNQYRQSTDPNKGITFREKVSDAWIGRRGGYDARGKEARFEDIVQRFQVRDTAEAMVGLGPEGMAIKIYNDALYGDDMYDEFGDYLFDEANMRKEQLKQSLGEEMFNYVEEYQGMKWDDLPEEFQMLKEAKRVLQPYWAVTDQVVRLFGQTYAESSAGKALIAKRKKQMRLTNREIARAYDRFYKQNE